MIRVSHLLRFFMAAGLFLLLAACGSDRNVTSTPTNTVWQLPPAFTPTRTTTGTPLPTPEVSLTPTTMSAVQPAAAPPIAAGANHNCAITAEGGLMCWGSNSSGQVGDGSRTARNKPVAVVNLPGRIVAVTAGLEHTCALTQEGGVLCWGRNKSGELGNGDTQRSTVPVGVNGLDGGVTAIAAGDHHTCAILNQSAVRCWGQNDLGQLGDGTTETANTPVEVQGLTGGVTAIAAGTAHTCALMFDGQVLCWGGNEFGQLGDSTDAGFRKTPGVVQGLGPSAAELAAKGTHTCVRQSDGAVQCWGENKFGQLGDGTFDNVSNPAAVTDLTTASQVTAGWYHTCAILEAGSLVCWGWNFNGQLGEGSMANRKTPVVVQKLSGKTLAVACGYGHTCALQDNGEIYCWGLNKDGQLGNLSIENAQLPVKVIGLSIPGVD